MRNICRAVMAAVIAASVAGPARAETPNYEAGMSALCAFGNLLYFPAKVLVAGGGFVTGGLVGALAGGDTRTAYAFWVPTMGGDWMLRAGHCAGDDAIAFLGDDYADTASKRGAGTDGTYTYEALYQNGN